RARQAGAGPAEVPAAPAGGTGSCTALVVHPEFPRLGAEGCSAWQSSSVYDACATGSIVAHGTWQVGKPERPLMRPKRPVTSGHSSLRARGIACLGVVAVGGETSPAFLLVGWFVGLCVSLSSSLSLSPPIPELRLQSLAVQRRRGTSGCAPSGLFGRTSIEAGRPPSYTPGLGFKFWSIQNPHEAWDRERHIPC
ncbi:unnamed protein product, partial [Prorocentrum cordatum]